MSVRVFISHSSKDKPAVEKLARAPKVSPNDLPVSEELKRHRP